MRSIVLRTVLVALIAVLALEGLLHVQGRSLGRTQEWYVAGVEYLVDSMDRLNAESVASDVVFAGTSLVMLGLRTDLLEQRLDSVRVAHNAGLPDGHTPIQRRWLLEEVVPRLTPDRVVWGVASLDFNGGRPQQIIELYESSRAGKVGLTGPLDRLLAEISATSKYREFLRGPLFVRSLFRQASPDPDPYSVPIESLMKSVEPWPILEKSEQRFAALRSSLLHDFYVGDREGSDFLATVRAMQADGIEVVIALMPVPAEYIAANDDGFESFAEWQSWMLDAADTLDVPIFDYSRAIPDGLFADYNHVDEEGADILTELLVDDLRELGW